MFSYFDPIDISDNHFTKETIVYLVPIQGRYAIKAISSSIGLLKKDPTTNAESYWLLNAEVMLKNEKFHAEIFPDKKLTSSLLSAGDVKTYFDVTVATVEFINFKEHQVDCSSTEISVASNPVTLFSPLRVGGAFLNSEEREALTDLNRYGLTNEMLLNRSGPDFRMAHYLALKKLVMVQSFTVVGALAEIDGLNSIQADGIYQGLLRADVIPLSNFWHIAALVALKVKGLTAEMLLQRNSGGYVFEAEHSSALRELVLTRNFTIDAALAEIDGLSSAKAGGIKLGLVRSDVIVLQNGWHMQVLAALKARGLTAQMLLDRNDGGIAFSANHQSALQRLVLERHFTVAAALSEIEHLDANQAYGVSNGLLRSDVAGLNGQQVFALIDLKVKGVTGQMLLNLETINGFRECHSDALRKLILEKGFEAAPAFAEINGLYNEQVRQVARGYSRSHVLRAASELEIQRLAFGTTSLFFPQVCEDQNFGWVQLRDTSGRREDKTPMGNFGGM